MKGDMVAITGNTFPVKDALKALGGRWDSAARCWRVPTDRAKEARALVAAAPQPEPKGCRVSVRRGNGLPHGQLWQPCLRRSCEVEPSCVHCEYCEYHCGCPAPPDEPVFHGGAVEPYGHGANGVIDP